MASREIFAGIQPALCPRLFLLADDEARTTASRQRSAGADQASSPLPCDAMVMTCGVGPRTPVPRVAPKHDNFLVVAALCMQWFVRVRRAEGVGQRPSVSGTRHAVLVDAARFHSKKLRCPTCAPIRESISSSRTRDRASFRLMKTVATARCV